MTKKESKPKHSLFVNRSNASSGDSRTAATVQRLKVYKIQPVRNIKDEVLSREYQSKELPNSRFQPDRRWFDIMDSNNNNSSLFNLRSILEKDKLNGKNFLDWERNLRIVLRFEGREDVLETPIPTLSSTPMDDEIASHKAILEKSVIVTCLMLASMDSSLQKKFEKMDAYSIIQQLKTMFGLPARVERYETHKAILECQLEMGKPVGEHVFKMIGHFENMERLGFPYSQELATDIILHSLHDGFKNFKLNFYMNGVEKTLAELYEMLITAEQNIQFESKKDVLMVQKGKGFKKVGAGKKGKQEVVAKASVKPNATAKPKVGAKSKCFYCGVAGHWKRNCPKYLENKKSSASTSGTQKV